MKITFKKDISDALQDKQLRGNFDRVMTTLMERRKAAFSDPQELETLRDQGNRIRRNAISKLSELLATLEKQCTKNGIHVHWAEDAAEGNQIVLDLLQAKKVTQLVKGKSMLSEEMHLNPFLEKHGIQCLETDLGEYIIQLAEEPPSHIVAPAIHKNKKQIAELLHEHIEGMEYTEDIEELTQAARHALRGEFSQAQAGITGVNFAVAETGTLCLVENEGNGRYCSTLPPLHIALMGLDKVVEKLSDIPPLLSLLTRSATGQPITGYFNMISSPRKAEEQDGPEEVHLVIVDNGRTRIHQDSELSQVMTCIRCGACMNHCPVYSRIGGHAYGETIPGPIGEILMPQLRGLDCAGHLAGASTLCGACSEVCPVKIPIPDLLLRLRYENVRKPGESSVQGAGSLRSFTESMVWKSWRLAHAHPAIWKMQRKMIGLLGDKLPENLPVLNQWTKYRTAPKLSKISLHDMVKENGIDEE